MASGDTLVTLLANHAQPPASNFATPDERNVESVRDFDDDTDESAEFGFVMPRHYGGGNTTLKVGWRASTATSGTISLDAAFKSFTDDDDDIDTKAFATARNANPTTASASGEIKYTEITFTPAQLDNIAAGEYGRMKLTRDADGTTSTDNMVGDMELVSIEIRET